MKIEHTPEKLLNIAVGKSRQQARWQNKKITWQELVDQLQETVRTYETVQEYKRMKKSKQDDIKDVGGFVGGFLIDGRRRVGYVKNRSIISLDADFAPPALWDDIKMLATNAMLCYSTHKHTPEKPRLRILVPLARDVTPEEYEAVGRKIADDIGIDFFDDTTFEANRLMFYPSTSKDAEFFFDVIDLPLLNPDTILAQYKDWTDVSSWAVSSRAPEIKAKQALKQGDPLEKPGLIGAFCRTYNIHEAIEMFLPHVYDPNRRGNRYTYLNGSTANGLVTYDDKFAYSNHGTDPASGVLCNAFDLVRVHLYGEFDKDTKEEVPVNRLPSWEKMMDLINSDDKTKLTIGRERLENAGMDFKEDFISSPENAPAKTDDDSWLIQLTTKKNGSYDMTIENLLTIMQHDPNLKNMARRNLFNDRIEITRKMPWTQHSEYWSDSDDAGLRYYLEKVYELESRMKIYDAFSLIMEDRAYHPVKDYLEQLQWDGIPRMEEIFIKYLGADDNEYTRTVTRKWLTAAVKRIYEPGCKFDYMVTLTGETGIGKSLIAKKLGMQWMSDTLTDIRGKEAYEALDGVWIMEMGELAALKRSDRETIKTYISKQEDVYRKAYGKRVTVNKRQCVFIGTTNEHEFLNDTKSTRRFWVIQTDASKRVGTVWEDFTPQEVDQVWAEVLINYRKGENIMELPVQVAEQALSIQSEHSQDSTYQTTVDEYLNTPVPENWYSLTIQAQRAWYNSVEDFGAPHGYEARAFSEVLMKRTKVCVQEIWYVALGEEKLPIPQPYISRELRDCVTGVKGWKREKTNSRYGSYGVQRGLYLDE